MGKHISFEEYLRLETSVEDKSCSYYVSWVKKYMRYCNNNLNLMHDLKESFLHEQRLNSVPNWQINQGEHAIHIYLEEYYPFIKQQALNELSTWSDIYHATTAQIRINNYSKSTE